MQKTNKQIDTKKTGFESTIVVKVPGVGFRTVIEAAKIMNVNPDVIYYRRSRGYDDLFTVAKSDPIIVNDQHGRPHSLNELSKKYDIGLPTLKARYDKNNEISFQQLIKPPVTRSNNVKPSKTILKKDDGSIEVDGSFYKIGIHGWLFVNNMFGDWIRSTNEKAKRELNI